MTEVKPIRIFIASSAELAEERKKCILLINQLNSAHKHLALKPVEWEYDMVHSSYPGFKDIQAAINPMLKESDLAVFLFYSRIGQYTREEFDYATQEGKKLMAFFKMGFSPSDEQTIEQYRELLEFKKSMNSSVLYKQYQDLNEFEKLLFANLNLELAERYPATTGNETVNTLSQSNQELIRMLGEKEKEITRLNEILIHGPDEPIRQQVEQLEQEKEAISQELLQSQEIIKQQAKDKEDLEKKLAPYKGNDALKEKALEEVEKGNYSEAEAYLKESAKESIENTASTFYEIAKIKKLQFQYAEAFRFFELAAKIDSENDLYSNEAGAMADDLGHYDKAIILLKRSLALSIKIHGKENSEMASAYNNLGSAYDNKGEYDKALKYYKKALTIDKKNYSEENPRFATRYNNIGTVYSNKKKYDTAIKFYEKALEIDKKNHGEENKQIATRYNNIGIAYYNKGEYNKAIEYYEMALIINKKILREGHPTIAVGYNNIGGVYNNTHEYNKAIEYYEKALAIDKEIFGREHPSIARGYNNLGTVYHNKEEYHTAIRYYDQCLLILQKFLPSDHPNIQTSQINRAFAQEALDEQQAKSNDPGPAAE